MIRSLSAVALTALLLAVAAPAKALLHIIDFSDPSVTGSFDVDEALLLPGSVLTCSDPTSDCDFNSFNVTFAGGEFTLDEAPGEVFRGYVNAGGVVDALFILMNDFLGTASFANLNIFRDPREFSVNPSGTYSIRVVPEPGTAALLALAVGALAVRRR